MEDGTAPTDLSDHVKSFVAHLTFTNTPKGLARAYQDAAKAERTSTERIFLDAGGFSAWFAYFLTKRAAKSATHFDGQAACNQMLSSVDEISFEDRRLLARQVQQAISPVNQDKFQEVFDKTVKPIENDLMVGPQKRRRTTDDNGDPSASAQLSPAVSANSAHMSVDTCQSNSRFNLVNPPILRVRTVFPTFLAGAIRKHPLEVSGNTWAAAITMSFLDVSSFGNKLGSMMSLEITSNKIERLANELFDAPIESTDEYRYLILPTGLRIIPSPDLTLRGCKRDVILEVFGYDIDNAIKASLAYKEEAEQGNPLTECVSMTISHRAKDGAVINLSLDEKEGVRVRRKLYE
ncbi:hypothetical protein S40293_11453 [Stachybotrys chartarum IBT 40293]|nr:hypothetical protein S40293_11453 [Stachybotrys chartarum IBT 40293]